MAKTLIELLDTNDAKRSKILLDYFDGKQSDHFTRLLDTPNSGRKDWRKNGLIPRTRNLTKMIVEKSGLLFNDKAPLLNIYDDKTSTDVDEVQSKVFLELLEQVEWIQFFTNFDSVVRLLKTALVLVQYDEIDRKLVLDVLTQENCAVILDERRRINTLIYKTGVDDDGNTLMRVYTVELVKDLKVDKYGVEAILNQYPNIYNAIPVSVFHDTNTPRSTFWNYTPEDLQQLNEMYNFHITDSEYSASWAKLQTLFTNSPISADSASVNLETVQEYASLLPRQASTGAANVKIGPASVVYLDTSGVDAPFADFKGPSVDLQPLDEMFNKWVSDFAGDWSVNVNFAGHGNADSGFKLIVEEMPNLELRKKRGKMMSKGFNHLFQIVKQVLKPHGLDFFSDSSIAAVEFYPPNLPVDEKQQEEVWSLRISEGRASRLDYFISQGMTKPEAEEKIAEIDAQRGTNSLGSPRTINVTKNLMNKPTGAP
jgi:hypothetical protein